MLCRNLIFSHDPAGKKPRLCRGFSLRSYPSCPYQVFGWLICSSVCKVQCSTVQGLCTILLVLSCTATFDVGVGLLLSSLTFNNINSNIVSVTTRYQGHCNVLYRTENVAVPTMSYQLVPVLVSEFANVDVFSQAPRIFLRASALSKRSCRVPAETSS